MVRKWINQSINDHIKRLPLYLFYWIEKRNKVVLFLRTLFTILYICITLHLHFFCHDLNKARFCSALHNFLFVSNFRHIVQSSIKIWRLCLQFFFPILFFFSSWSFFFLDKLLLRFFKRKTKHISSKVTISNDNFFGVVVVRLDFWQTQQNIFWNYFYNCSVLLKLHFSTPAFLNLCFVYH